MRGDFVIGTNPGARHGCTLTFAVSAEGLHRAQFAPCPPDAAHNSSNARAGAGWRGCACAELPRAAPIREWSAYGPRGRHLRAVRAPQDPRVELLVRAKNNWHRRQHKLFEWPRAAPERARLHIAVGRQSARPKTSKQKLKTKRKERLAEVSLHYSASSSRLRRAILTASHWRCGACTARGPPARQRQGAGVVCSRLCPCSREDAERMLRYALRAH